MTISILITQLTMLEINPKIVKNKTDINKYFEEAKKLIKRIKG